MSYQLKADESIGKGIRRIARGQTRASLLSLQTIELGTAEPDPILECRKRIKKVRGLLRLVRGSIGEDDYRLADKEYRHATNALAGLRDSQAQLEILDRVVRSRGDLIPPGGVLSVRAELAQRAEVRRANAADAAGGSIDDALDALLRAEAQIERWTFSAKGWDALSPGLSDTYRRGSVHLSRSQPVIKKSKKSNSSKKANNSKRSKTRPASESLHSLRKQAKYTRFQLRLLRRAAPSLLNPMAERFAEVTGALGDARDLGLLRDELQADPDAFGGDAVVAATCRLTEELRTDLERRGLSLANRLYVERPERLVARLGGYWTIWENSGDEQAVGRVEVIAGVASTGPTLTNLSQNLGEDRSDNPGDELDQLTMAELRLVARTSDLPGRSKVGRDDLMAMLRASGVTGRT